MLVNLVLKAAGHVHKGLNASKFALKWEGPYVIHESCNSGYCMGSLVIRM